MASTFWILRNQVEWRCCESDSKGWVVFNNPIPLLKVSPLQVLAEELFYLVRWVEQEVINVVRRRALRRSVVLCDLHKVIGSHRQHHGKRSGAWKLGEYRRRWCHRGWSQMAGGEQKQPEVVQAVWRKHWMACSFDRPHTFASSTCIRWERTVVRFGWEMTNFDLGVHSSGDFILGCF